MAKNIFHDFEVKKLSGDMVLTLEKTFEPETTTEVVEAVPVPEGPTLEDLKNEAEEFKRQWEIEKLAIKHKNSSAKRKKKPQTLSTRPNKPKRLRRKKLLPKVSMRDGKRDLKKEKSK